MQFKIKVDHRHPELYFRFAYYLYNSLQKDISRYARAYSKKYKVREKSILECTLLKWIKVPPETIDLIYYLDRCIELRYINGYYIIRLNSTGLIRGSYSNISLLIRILEYGTDKIPAFPMVRRLFKYYKTHKEDLFNEFMEREF